MNARLMTATPQSIGQQAELISKLCSILLESSEQLKDIQFGLVKQSLKSAKAHAEVLHGSKQYTDFVNGYSQVWMTLMQETTTMLSESSSLGVQTGKQLGQVFDNCWEQGKQSFCQMTDESMSLMSAYGNSLVKGFSSR